MPTITSANTTLEYFDGWDDYNTSQISRYCTGGVTSSNPWFSSAISANITVLSSGGRNGTGAMQCNNAGQQALLFTFSSQATRTVGFAIKTNAYGYFPVVFLDVLVPQVGLYLNGDGTLSVYRPATNGAIGTLLSGPSTLSLTTGVWYYVEFTATVNNSTGSATVDVNGTQWLTASSLNTRNTSNNSANSVALGQVINTGNVTVQYDDFYSRSDGTMCGDVRVESILPNGAGNTTQLTKGGSTINASNYLQVNENPADDDVTYNYAPSSGLEDEYTYPPIPTTTGTIFAVMTIPVCRNDSAGSVAIESVYRVSSTDYFGGSQNVGSTTYAAYPDIQGQNPNTSTAWTVTTVNAAQFGIKRVT